MARNLVVVRGAWYDVEGEQQFWWTGLRMLEVRIMRWRLCSESSVL